MKSLSVGDVPVIVAPMAGGPSTPALVAAAAASGALGFLAAGYKSVEMMAGEIAAVRDSTDHFGVNVFVPDGSPVDRAAIERYRERLRLEAERYGVELPEIRWDDDDHWSEKIGLLIADPVPWVSFAFGVPDSATIRDLKRAGSQVLITVTNPDEAELAFDSGADGVIAQSGSAGGHSSTTNPALYRGDTTTLDLVAEIRFRVPLPVVAAGGIASREDLEAVLGTRAFAVQIGTHFLKASEAGTRPTQREAMGDPRFAETVVTRAFTGRSRPGTAQPIHRHLFRLGAARLSGHPPPHGTDPRGGRRSRRSARDQPLGRSRFRLRPRWNDGRNSREAHRLAPILSELGCQGYRKPSRSVRTVDL